MSVLKDIEAQKELSEIGFKRFDLIDNQLVDSLQDYYYSLHSPVNKGFHPSMFWKDVETKKNISDLICNALNSWVNEHFIHHRILYGNFMVKESGKESIMKLHQDWSYVDEEFGQSFAIWFPLQDLTDNNGALSMIPRSHFSKNHHRGPGTHCPFLENQDYIIKKYGQPLYLKKGEPVVWEHHLLHYSPPNLSAFPRVAVTAIIVPKGQPIYHYFKNSGEDILYQYEVEHDFYFNYDIGKAPSNFCTLIHQFPIHSQTMSLEKVDKLLGGKPVIRKVNYFQKFKKIFS
ncbi:MAG: phytanoyl-CoA dioxygenase family protein [Chitinophagales bacterium]|nr:phytanoyl-CoA dioxygenase family protein [Chitinophagales bacterium]